MHVAFAKENMWQLGSIFFFSVKDVQNWASQRPSGEAAVQSCAGGSGGGEGDGVRVSGENCQNPEREPESEEEAEGAPGKDYSGEQW